MKCPHRFTSPDPEYKGGHWSDMSEHLRVCDACGTCVQTCTYCAKPIALRGCRWGCEHDSEDSALHCQTCDRCAACCREKAGPLTLSDLEHVLRYIAGSVAQRSIERAVLAAPNDTEAADAIMGTYGGSPAGSMIEVRGAKITARVFHRTGKLTALQAARMIRRRALHAYRCLTCDDRITSCFEPVTCDDRGCAGGIALVGPALRNGLQLPAPPPLAAVVQTSAHASYSTPLAARQLPLF